MNTRLARQVLDYLHHHPERWDQRVCFEQYEGGRVLGCFGGWAIVFGAYENQGTPWPYSIGTSPAAIEQARELLDLTPSEAEAIFFYTQTNPLIGRSSHPTLAELCQRIEKVTGYRYGDELKISV
mgnify:CR=1 FL=1